MGVRSLPVQLGVLPAARVACWFMAIPQLAVMGLLIFWEQPLYSAGVGVLLLLQVVLMRRFLQDPTGRALWYSGFGVPLFVAGMMVSALALRHMGATP
jgi:chlorophyll synthase